MDCREAEIDDRPGLEFSWDGNDECDPASGRGWAALQSDGSVAGHIYFLWATSGFSGQARVIGGVSRPPANGGTRSRAGQTSIPLDDMAQSEHGLRLVPRSTSYGESLLGCGRL